ncbi:hypothetical protein SAMN02910275_02951 [Butyrivibrio sp. INlla18]|uniref:DUF6076 domain-containing protein n=1 Tax=Butyrivibrio sp. INlla18 TaxID=1520806 RepID=UPI000889655B|nr:DUF6076 domain-containing protein [Butyrivibrio sp. INlla18]SDA79246.1 hypothetical protein SAMN02910275_02951 [Butyrivibrio sp. INlla18]
MNIYSSDFILSGYEISGVYYMLQVDKHAESIYLSYKEGRDAAKAQKHYFTRNASMLSSWMQVLDYGALDEAKTDVALQKLSETLDILSVKLSKDSEKLALHLEKQSGDQIPEMVKSVLGILKEVFELRPALSCLYTHYYPVLKDLMDYHMGTLTTEDIALPLSIQLFSIQSEVDSLKEDYDRAREYCQAVFLTTNAPGSDLSPEIIAAIYHNYCMESGRNDFSVDYGERMSVSLIPVNNIPWESYLDKHKNMFHSSGEKKETHNISDFTHFLHIGIDHMLGSESVIRICKLCGGYFRIRYTSSQEYCTRLYGDTKAACNEYASRKSYKEKLFQHPIHQEFTKSYNKLYGRIRRGKLPADTPLMDQLKRLHDDYYERYENTHQKEREAVWKEYIEKNKELLE